MRRVGPVPRRRRFANRFADFWISWAAGHRVLDSQSGQRAYPADFLRAIDLPHDPTRTFTLDSELLIEAAARGYTTVAVPIDAVYGPYARPSHFRNWLDTVRIAGMIARRLLAARLNLPGLVRSLSGGAVVHDSTVELAVAEFRRTPRPRARVRLMAQRPPARPGDPIDAIETPALVVDLDALERNLDALAHAVAAKGLRLRPHAKSHKTPAIAKLQVARGAVGICCQKVDEAVAFVEGGIGDVLVTNEVVAPSKLLRLAQLARQARIGVLVDDARVVAPLAQAARHAGATIDVYVEVDVGAGRCGVGPGDPAATLATQIASEPGLRFAGLHCYHGAAQHLRTPDERRDAIASAAEKTMASKRAVERAGLAVPIVTGAGTGTWEHELASGVWNEMQVGSYIFMDADYGRNTPAEDEQRFEHSLFVVASVMSVPSTSRAICDAGLKAFAFDSGLPVVHGRTDLAYRKASDEHGVLEILAGAAAPGLGERMSLIPGHCDPTVNLYDWIVAFRGRRVEHVWPVAARGALG